MRRTRILLTIIVIAGVVLALFVATFVLAVAVGERIIPGASDYRTRLPNGYFLSRGAPGSSKIYQDRDGDDIYAPALMVGPSEYGLVVAVSGFYVLGNLDTEEEAWGVPEVPDRYFIIDTQVDVIMKGLSFEQYEQKMHDLGFEELPELIRPNKRTRFPMSG